MRLILELVSPQSEAMASAPRFVVGYDPVVIGRDAKCDWVFNDRYVSGQHAQIRFFNGLFFVEAIGKNPVAIDEASQHVARGKSQPLRDSCRLFIDVHEVRVSVVDDDSLAPGPQRPQIAVPPPPVRVPTSDAWNESELLWKDAKKNESDVLDSMGLGQASPRRKESRPIQDPASHHYVPPSPVSPGAPGRIDVDIPVDPDWWRKGSSRIERDPMPRASAPDPRSDPIPAAQPAPARSAQAQPMAALDIAELLRGAGIDPASVELSPELALQFGEILRIVVMGTMDVLRARAEIKEQFRLPMTRMQRSENNPLKFAADVDDALFELLIKRNAAYLAPVAAFEQAFEEIRDHQLAMLQGVRVSFDQLMQRLDPQMLQDDVDRQGKSGLVIGSSRARYWDSYEKFMQDLAKSPDDRFRQLFGNAFGKAYEEQLKRLNTARRLARRGRKS